MRKIFLLLVISFIISFTTAVSAGQYCTEHITQVIEHTNGNVYFTTDQSCPSWCELSRPTTDSLNRGYSLLLSALLSGRYVRFYWPNASTPCQSEPAYSSPDSSALQIN